MKRVETFRHVFSPGWDACPSQSPSIKFAGTDLYTCVERGTESRVSSPRTQRNVPVQSWNPVRSIWRRARDTNNEAFPHHWSVMITDYSFFLILFLGRQSYQRRHASKMTICWYILVKKFRYESREAFSCSNVERHFAMFVGVVWLGSVWR